MLGEGAGKPGNARTRPPRPARKNEHRRAIQEKLDRRVHLLRGLIRFTSLARPRHCPVSSISTRFRGGYAHAAIPRLVRSRWPLIYGLPAGRSRIIAEWSRDADKCPRIFPEYFKTSRLDSGMVASRHRHHPRRCTHVQSSLADPPGSLPATRTRDQATRRYHFVSTCRLRAENHLSQLEHCEAQHAASDSEPT